MLQVRTDGVYHVQDIYGKPLERRIERGWHVLFVEQGTRKRFGYVLTIDVEAHEFSVLDSVAYPNAPQPLGAQVERIAMENVIAAGNGYSGLWKRDVYQGGRKVGKRDIHIVDANRQEQDLGFIERRGGGRAYVEWENERWCIRE